MLTSIGHTSANTVTVSAATDITLTVPYGYTGPLDLANGLTIAYHTSTYSFAIASFESGSQAAVGGPAVDMLVTYKKTGDETLYTTTYHISVQEAAYVAPTFAGTISKTVTLPNDLTFAATDFSGKYTANNGAVIGAIAISGSNLSCGALQYNGSDYDFGTLVSMADIAAGKLTFDTADEGTVSYLVEAYAGTDTTTPIGAVILTVTIQKIAVPTITAAVSQSVTVGSTLTFALSNFSSCYNLNSGALANIEITPTNTGYGTWYSGSSAFTGVTTFTSATVGTLKFTGTAVGTATFTWRVSNQSGYSTSGAGSVTVNAATASKISYSTNKNTAVTFLASAFNTACYNLTGETLSYVNFSLPASSYGTLYYNYTSSSSYGSVVSAGTAYYYSYSPYLSYIAFVPYTNYSGTVTVNYTGYTTSGKSYAGTVQVTVENTDADVITYETDEDEAVTFSPTDFNSVCDDLTGSNLSYVKFTLPSSSYGKLYYNYTSASSYGSLVSASTKYYRSSSPYLSYVTFVPYSNYTGTVTVSYTGYSTDGDAFTGTVKITVGDADDADVITYETDEDEAVTFSPTDFNSVCDDLTGSNLSYVKFTLPSSSYGKLYYNYTSASSYGSLVSASTKYYRSSSPYLSYVTFVPYSNYTGTVTVSYTGYSTDGDSFTGTVKITVGDADDADVITYSTDQNKAITFSPSDFNSVCDDVTGSNLSYVKFTLPSSSYGKLYYNYTSSTSYGSLVSASTKYYRSSSPYLSSVAFVPYSGYTGTVTVSYTGYSTDGDTFTGTVKITVGSSTADPIPYATTSNTPVSFIATTFNSVCYDVTGSNLSYVKFTLPSSSYGKLYYNYTSSTSYGSLVSASTGYYRTTSPYLSYVSFVPTAGYTGTVTIPYTGYGTDGSVYTGTVKITVTAATGSGSAYFKDVSGNYAWAAPQIDYLYSKGIVSGTGNATYAPGSNITRGDFILMLASSFNFGSKATISGNFPDVPKGSYYYEAIAAAKALGVAKGSDGNFYPTAALTRQDAMVLIVRTLEVYNKGLAAGTSSNLASYADKGEVDSYALTAVATLVKAKIIEGDGTHLYPISKLTRAEMAAILYAVLTK